MSEERIANLEQRVNRLEKAFRLLPFVLLAAIAVATVVIMAWR